MSEQNFRPWRETLDEILKNLSPQEREEFDKNVLMHRQVLEDKIRQYNTQSIMVKNVDDSDSV